MEESFDNVVLLRNAADDLIKFFDEAIEVAKKYMAATSEYDVMVSKINPTVDKYSKVHHDVEKKMGMMAFLHDEQMIPIRKMVSDKEQELRRVLV